MYSIQSDTPDCFGKSWDPKDVLCSGGADPTFRNDRGSHIRTPCDFYGSCGARVGALRTEATRMIPPQNLVRPPLYPQNTAIATATTATQPLTQQQTQAQIQQQALALAQQMFQHQQFRPGTPPTQIPYGMMPPGYQQMMPVNYHMPSYLSAQEDPTHSFWGALGRSLFRSVGKSLGHTISHFFDAVPLGSAPRRE